MMVCLELYAYCVGVFSSRKIAQACARNLAFIALVGTEFKGSHMRVFSNKILQKYDYPPSHDVMTRLSSQNLSDSNFSEAAVGSRPLLVTSGETWYISHLYTEKTRTAIP